MSVTGAVAFIFLTLTCFIYLKFQKIKRIRSDVSYEVDYFHSEMMPYEGD